jgi:hypothetical protein
LAMRIIDRMAAGEKRKKVVNTESCWAAGKKGKKGNGGKH